MSLDSEPNKWICEYCTYENFPSAQKCTMCRGAKPLISEDIYKLKNESQSPSMPSAMSPIKTVVNEKCNSWRCDECKRVNSTVHKSCTACNATRYREDCVREQLNSLTIGENEIISVATNEQRNHNNQKWSCQVCTYENWPRAVKCIMCCTTRSRISPVSSTHCVNSPEREIISNIRNVDDGTNRSKK